MQTELALDFPGRPGGRPGFLTRYRKFLSSKETVVAFTNGVLLIAGFSVSLAGAPRIGRVLYLASAVIGGLPLFILAARNVWVKRDVTAGVMASVAMIAAILVGEYSAAALVVFMFAIGDWLENLTIARANNALRDLAKFVPATVTVRRNGQDLCLPIAQVRVGDLVLVRSGERIGVDGRVEYGNAAINQSAITGESMPVEKKAGDDVFAGTLNEVGALEVKVTRTGTETTLGQIVQLVKAAQVSQAPVQRLANQYARILVPVTFGIAVLVFLFTGDILRSITVLVVVCPCALVLATPTAVAAAIGHAAKQGMLVKSGAAIEQIGRVAVVAFDKTGTLTRGKPVLQQVVAWEGISADRLLALAVAAEQYSEHPLARSIVQAGREQEIGIPTQVEAFISLPGYGVSARVEQQDILLGKQGLLVDRGIVFTDQARANIAELESAGNTVVAAAVMGHLAGWITLADTPRPEAQAAISALKSMGIEVVMITGDNHRAAARMAAELGVDRLYADVLPPDKLAIIREMQAGGKKVAFVGDGVNDAPALAAADIGVAMGVAGTDVAMETAAITLMADELERLPHLIRLSRQTLRVIRQNVLFSMLVNVLSVFLGGFGIIGPVIGALMHEISALPVLANSARLIGYRGSHLNPIRPIVGPGSNRENEQ